MSSIDYLAGLIDGEGTIALARETKSSPYRYPAITVSNTSRAIIDWLVQEYGGIVVIQKKYAEHHKQAWNWRIRHRAAFDLLTKVGPLLKDEAKSHRALTIVAMYDIVTQRNGKYTPEQRNAKLAFEKEVLGPFV